MDTDLTYISFGAGVQSTALLVMSNLGLYDCPIADVAIFADTQLEPQWVYRHLDFIEKWSTIPLIRVTSGNLRQDLVERVREKKKRVASIPVWTTGKDGKPVPLWRQCTQEYKIAPIQRKVRELLGYKPRQVIKHRVSCLIGISSDEIMRMRTSRVRWTTNVYPLIDAGLSRDDCRDIITKVGLPVPKRSACVFCPFHSDEYWSDLQANHPEEWEATVQFDETIRNMKSAGVRSDVYLHRSLTPLHQIKPKRGFEDDAFMNECEGQCGI